MSREPEKFGVAVSGGADSVYLLHHLRAQNLPLTVLHINHKLRGPESDADECFVRDLALALNLPFLTHTAPITHGNIEQEAREARNRWFQTLVYDRVVDRIALGHTQSDQAETVLFRFLRGSGTAGLAAICPETASGLFRPLLHLTREQIRASLEGRNISWRDDSSNGSTQFARNRIRHSLLPQLTREWNPSLTQTLAQTADWAQAEEAYWAIELRQLAAEYFQSSPPHLLVRLNPAFPVAVQRRLIRHAIFTARGHLRRIDFSHIEAIRTLSSGRVPLPGLGAEISLGQLRLGPSTPLTPYNHSLTPPATIPLPVYGTSLSLNLRRAGPSNDSLYDGNKHQLDWECMSGRLELRNWHPGDRYRRVGRSNEEKLKLLFQKARIPAWERISWPVLLCENRSNGWQIAWTRQFGPAADFACTPHTRTVLLIAEEVISENANRNL